MSRSYKRRGNKNSESKRRFYTKNSANSVAQSLANFANTLEKTVSNIITPAEEKPRQTKFNNATTVKKDMHGNEIYVSRTVGKNDKFEYWVQYNEDNLPIWYHDSRGYEWKCTYTRKKNIAEFWDNTGYSETYNYYKNNTVKCTNSLGNSIKKIVDKTCITRVDFVMSK